jgi:hypothetical protein
MISGIQILGFDVEELRARLCKMADPELLRYGQAAKYMCTEGVERGKPPCDSFVEQLKIAREVWRERHPKLPLNESI